MAEGRMLKKRMSKSKKVAKVKTDTARVLYFMMFPHLDVEGRLEADPVEIKGVVCPKIKTLTTKTIKSALTDLHRVGLIVYYEIDGEMFLEYTRFHDFNKINRNKEAKSHIPAPTPEQLQSNSGVTPSEVKLSISEEKLSKGNKDAPTKKKFLEFVFLTEEEYKKLKDTLNGQCEDYIDRLNNYIGSKGKKYKSHYHTILNWYKRDKPESNSSKLQEAMNYD